MPAPAHSPPETLQDLIGALAARGEAAAVVAFRAHETETWSFARLASTVDHLSAGLVARGLSRGEPVGILAPNSPRWVATYLAVVNAGAIAMPLDERASAPETFRLITANGCRWLVTTIRHADRFAPHFTDDRLSVVAIDSGTAQGERRIAWEALMAVPAVRGPNLKPDDVAVIAHTSGTTGAPKTVPLTHANLMSNVSALTTERLIGEGDRALLPLPLHHVYPMTCGMLTPLAAGAAVVFPAGVSGPELTAALRDSGVTHLLGVPRLYTALLEGMRAQIEARGGLAARCFPGLLALSTLSARALHLRIGRVFFRPLHRRLAPRLRLLVSGGAALDVATEETLEGLGWQVLSGYGLTETSPILTFNRRGAKRVGSAGRPLPGVSLRIVNAGGDGIGEIQAQGPSVFAGYRNDQTATQASFTADGWFRTGDLGTLDRDGYLHITARQTETIVLPDGKKVFPETIEAVYAESPLIQELAILSHRGKLVGLVVPNVDAIRRHGSTRAEGLIREELAERGAALPSYQRLSGFAFVHEPLPRTHLGKPRRFLLPALYERALEHRGPDVPPEMSEADRALLGSPVAARLWTWLATRFPDRPLSLETSPQLDLGVDSLGWVDLSLDIQRAAGLTLTEAAIARIVTLRDLLREAISAAQQPEPTPPTGSIPAEIFDPDAATLGLRAIRWLVAAGNRLILRGLFGLRVIGAEKLPRSGPCLICPNHVSYLDPFALGAALPYERLRHTWWAGWTDILFSGKLQRAFSRIAQVVPIDPDRAVASSLAWGGAVLDHDRSLVWFPEGGRSSDGKLQRFLPGVGALLAGHPVPVLPVYIAGTFAAWPRGRRFPRLRRITVTIGEVVAASSVLTRDQEMPPPSTLYPEEIADRVRTLVYRLAEEPLVPA